MNTQELLQELQAKVANGEVSRDEIVQMFGVSQNFTPNITPSGTEKDSHHFTVTKMLYALGVSVVVIGIFIFIAQIWDDISSFARILTTLGLGFLMALLGSMLIKSKPESNLGTVFHLIGGALIPGGAIVALEELRLDTDWSLAIIFTGIFAFYFFLNYAHKNTVLTFWAIVNGTVAVYLAANAMLGSVLGYSALEILFQYLTMALGLSYLLLAYAFKGNSNAKLVGALNFFGITGLLGAAFIRVFDSGIWELFYFILLFGTLFVSVYLRSRIILIMSTLFLIAHVTYITSEYFADSLGWPVVLVLLGFLFIGLGYASITINNKYIKQ